ncbi:MAG TPA: DUF4232 domain-containing protein [Candidatus Dormibacteraeota bacterium]|nr:DUF4232 domain-containing protein [Candidatus Dormibacteraeota bacterium]
MVMRNVAIAVAMVALLIGCAGTHWSAATSPVPKTVPWLPLPPDLTPLPEPSPQPVPVPTGTPMCSAADLEGAVIGSNGAGGHVLTTFAFASRGQVACELDGTPSVTLLDASGRPLPFSIRAPFFPNEVSGPALVVPGPNPVPYEGLTYGQARLTIDWNSQPEVCPQSAPVMVAHARISTANRVTLSIDIPGEPAAYACAGVGVGSFADPPIQTDSRPAAPPPQPTISAPAQVKAGSQLLYVVRLANETKLPIDFGKQCFNYEEELFADMAHGSPPLGGKHFYRLNCAAAGLVGPLASKTFAMVFAVPSGAAPGTYTLVFNIGSGSAMPQSAHSMILVN